MLRFRVAALTAALIIGTTTAAAAQGAPEARQRDGRAQHGRMHKARGEQALFRGITLSEAQKSRLEAIRNEYRPRFEALREASRPHMQAMRGARQKDDTAAARVAFSNLQRQRAQMRTLMEQQRAEVRGILTSEQQTTFDRNLVEMRERMAKRAEHRGKRGGEGRRGRRGGERRGS